MEDIVAVEVELENGEKRYSLTWGRIQDSVDPNPLEELILQKSSKFAIEGKAVRAKLCASLQEASTAPHFFECFFDMCQKKIPFGVKTYPKWKSGMKRKM